jgi:hypothetical protein
MSDASVTSSLAKIWRVLTFRASRKDFVRANTTDFVVAMLFVWVAGIGRHWDRTAGDWWKNFGLGSVGYVFVLALLFYLVIRFAPGKRYPRYFQVVTFVAMTGPPALLYAIPVEMIFPDPKFRTANTINAVFLAVVALWRVFLLAYFLRTMRISTAQAFYGMTVPIALILMIIVMTDSTYSMVMHMGGFHVVTPHDKENEGVLLFAILSMMAASVLVPAYLLHVAVVAYQRFAKRRLARLQMPKEG